MANVGSDLMLVGFDRQLEPVNVAPVNGIYRNAGQQWQIPGRNEHRASIYPYIWKPWHDEKLENIEPHKILKYDG